MNSVSRVGSHPTGRSFSSRNTIVSGKLTTQISTLDLATKTEKDFLKFPARISITLTSPGTTTG